jgi:ATP synthase B/B' CF(0)
MGDIELFGIQISLGTMIYQAIIFTILVFLIKKFVMKKLLNVMEDRQTYIENQLLLAEKYRLTQGNRPLPRIAIRGHNNEKDLFCQFWKSNRRY